MPSQDPSNWENACGDAKRQRRQERGRRCLQVQSRGRVASSRTRLTGQPVKRYKVLSQGSRPWILTASYTRFSVPEDPARERMANHQPLSSQLTDPSNSWSVRLSQPRSVVHRAASTRVNGITSSGRTHIVQQIPSLVRPEAQNLDGFAGSRVQWRHRPKFSAWISPPPPLHYQSPPVADGNSVIVDPAYTSMQHALSLHAGVNENIPMKSFNASSPLDTCLFT